MSTFELSDASEWGGRPVARRLADAAPRARLVAAGVVGDTWTVKDGDGVAHLVRMEDEGATVDLVFLGRHEVGGLVTGARVSVEGVARLERGRLVVWNPLYRIDQPAPRDG